jgi:hypothetical protein
MNTNIVIGVILIVYGFIKLSLCILYFASPYHIKQKIHKIPGLGFLVSIDVSVTGKVMTTFLLLLSIFTLVHGLSILNVFNESVNHAMESMVVQVLFNLLMGILMTAFFAIIVFTDVNIPKDPSQINSYKLVGFGGGLIFLLTVPLIIVFYKYWQPLRWKGVTLPGAIMLIIVALFIALCFVATYFSTESRSGNDIANLLMIPLNLV